MDADLIVLSIGVASLAILLAVAWTRIDRRWRSRRDRSGMIAITVGLALLLLGTYSNDRDIRSFFTGLAGSIMGAGVMLLMTDS